MRIGSNGLTIAIALLAVLAGCSGQEAEVEAPFSHWAYLGQKLPGTRPRLFAPELISTGNSERCLSFSPDGRELYYQIGFQSPTTVIVQRRYEKGAWTAAETVSFSGSSSFNDLGPVLSRDGNTLFFYSNRDGSYDIYRAERVGDGYSDPEKLGPGVNTEFFEGHPCVLPNESYLIFSSGGRPDDRGGGDLYICMWLADEDTWSEAWPMRNEINTAAHEAAPTLSPEGRFLFFTSQRQKNSDVYWFDIIGYLLPPRF